MTENSANSATLTPPNTKGKSSSISKVIDSRRWFGTINNASKEEIDLIPLVFKEYIYGKENAPSTGTFHLHFFGKLKHERTFDAMKKDFPRANLKMITGTTKQNEGPIEYCRKQDWYGYVTNIPKYIRPKSPLDGKTPYQWQSQILDIIKSPPDDRSVYWFWESTGNFGKSALVKHIVLHNRNAIMVSGKGSDIKYAIASCQVKPNIILIDLPRSFGSDINYGTIEEVKNGCFFSGKYESNMIVMDYPHVIIFANEPPDLSMLSSDRWKVTELKK